MNPRGQFCFWPRRYWEQKKKRKIFRGIHTQPRSIPYEGIIVVERETGKEYRPRDRKGRHTVYVRGKEGRWKFGINGSVISEGEHKWERRIYAKGFPPGGGARRIGRIDVNDLVISFLF